jgi:RNA polymerase sigma-70 factor (ECF subfamily)
LFNSFYNSLITLADEIKKLAPNIMRLIPKSSFKTWIIGITRRKIADFYRKFYKNKEEQSIDINVFEYGEDIYFEKDIEQLADKIVVQNAVSTLSGIEKELVYLIFNAQLTYRQVAQITNIPNGTIKSKMFSIKAKLKNSLSKEGEYD